MINVSIRYFNILAAYAEKKNETVAVENGTTVKDLIHSLCQNKPPLFGEVVLLDGEIGHHLRVFRNERILDGDLLDEQLEHGDQLMLFPAIAGG